MILLVSEKDRVKLSIYEQGLISNAIRYEIRGTSIYVAEDEFQLAKTVIEQGQWLA